MVRRYRVWRGSQFIGVLCLSAVEVVAWLFDGYRLEKMEERPDNNLESEVS